jgi:hypothetical protein
MRNGHVFVYTVLFQDVTANLYKLMQPVAKISGKAKVKCE